MYVEFQQALAPLGAFSLADIRQVFPNFDRRRLSEWQDKDYIVKLRRGYYAFKQKTYSEAKLFQFSNKIYQPSYLSLESALSWYGLIPEGVYTITAVSSRKTQNFTTSFARFDYRSLKSELMFGYRVAQGYSQPQQHFLIAEKEKLLLDYLYLHPELKTAEDLLSLRLNQSELAFEFNWPKLKKYLAVFANKTLEKKIKLLRSCI